MGWADEEFQCIDLGDKRRNRRDIQLVERLAERPTESLPGACRGWGETQAAYRFFGNEAIAAQAILEPHREAAIRRMQPHPVVLCLQDTELDFNGRTDKGDGPIKGRPIKGRPR